MAFLIRLLSYMSLFLFGQDILWIKIHTTTTIHAVMIQVVMVRIKGADAFVVSGNLAVHLKMVPAVIQILVTHPAEAEGKI